MDGDVSQTFLAAVGAPRPQPQLAQRQAQIITNHQQVLQGQLVEPHRLADRPAAQVHERIGLQEQDSAKVDLDLGELPLEFAARTSTPILPGQPIDNSKPMLCRVPWYLLPGLPRPTTSFIVANAAALGPPW